MVTRQFTDLGLAPMAEDVSNSSEGSLSPNTAVKASDDNATDNGEGDAVGWATVDRLADIHQTVGSASDAQQEAIMRKARVSVRARSEAPMVDYLNLYSLGFPFICFC